MKRRWRQIVLILLGASIALLLIGVGCADRFILPPAPGNVQHDGAERKMLGAKGCELEAFVARSPGTQATQPTAYVLRFTGDAAGAAKFTANRWQQRPVEVWAVNYPGYGASAGPRTLRNLAEASLVAFDEVKRVAGERPIVVEGFSLGTTPALCVAARRPVAGLILQNPPPLKQLVIGRFGWWNLWLLAIPVSMQVPAELDSVANAGHVSAPAVFLMAGKDETIPPKYQQKIIDGSKGEIRVIHLSGAGHYAPLTPSQEDELHDAMDWLLSQISHPATTHPAGG